MSEQHGETRSIGGLWTKVDKNGKHFVSGMVEVNGVKQDIVIFKNLYKQEGDRKPDWKIMKSEPRREKPVESSDPF